MKEIDARSLRVLEAMLFAAETPLDETAMRARLPQGADLEGLLALLEAQYAGRGVNLTRAGRTWAFATAPDVAPHLAEARAGERRLSRAAIETLAIVAYHQPVTRSEIEAIRGVQSGRGSLEALLQEGWIAPGDRRESPGRPVTWVTTDQFLRQFNLRALRDLPNADELRALGFAEHAPASRASVRV